MRYWLVYLFVSVSFFPFAQERKVFTTADYDKAVKALGTAAQQVYSKTYNEVNWLDGDRFWFKSVNGLDTQYVLMDASGKKLNKKSFNNYNEMNLPQASRAAGNRGSTEVSSPDGKRAVFIKNWNLYVKDLVTKNEKQLTTDGIENFGYATDNAGWKHSDRPIVLWSPDGRSVATYQQDDRHLKNMYLVKTTVGAPELQQWKYPLPGDSAISKIHRLVINTETGEMVRFKMPADDHRGTLCDDIACNGYLGDTQWSDDGKQLAFISVSRDHKVATLRLADTKNGEVRTVFEEKVATQYESGRGKENWKFMPGTNEFIWYSQRDDWGHLYLYDLKTGQLKNQITQGNFVVTQVQRIDEKTRTIWFEANGREAKNNPYFSHFYKISFSGKNLVSLSPEMGNHVIRISPSGKYFSDRYSTPEQAPVSVLKDMNGKIISVISKSDTKQFTAAGWKAPTEFKVRSANNNFDLYGLMNTPSDLDPSKKYPVVVYIYPGPQGGSVGNWSFTAMPGDRQALAELGFVVVALEGSCNPGRSKSFHDACYGEMGENTLADQVSGLKQLAEKYPYLDLDRVGIWGHSGGGFATADAMFSYPDFFKVGIAESGNHDNRNYEDDWGERYIGLLEGDNYARQANQVNAKNLKGKLLIAHGNLDDNVPPYNSYLVVDALIKANKDFDLLIFPNARHGYGTDSYYMMRKRWDYFVEHLMGAKPPANYQIKR